MDDIKLNQRLLVKALEKLVGSNDHITLTTVSTPYAHTPTIQGFVCDVAADGAEALEKATTV